MNNFAIKLVKAGWNDLESIQFSEHEFDQWKNELNSGTRLLIFEPDVANAIIAEVEITEDFNKQSIMPQMTAISLGLSQTGMNGTTTTSGATPVGGVMVDAEDHVPDSGVYTIPVDHIHKRENVNSISVKRVREVIGIDNFPRVDETFLPLDESAYENLVAEWR